jgi:predicted methyltransferase
MADQTKKIKKNNTGPQQTSEGVAIEMQPIQDIVEHMKDYARERPEVAALWCFGMGFILGWKLKPW